MSSSFRQPINGRSSRSRARMREKHCSRSLTRNAISATTRFPTWRRARSRCAAAFRRGFIASRSPANWPTRLVFPPDTATRLRASSCRAGAPFGMVPYGTEALGVMRIEKGHVSANELDGRTTARDLGLGRMMSTKKDYIGRVLAGRPALLEPDRMSVVGFKPTNPVGTPARGRAFRAAQRRDRCGPRSRRDDIGRVFALAWPLDWSGLVAAWAGPRRRACVGRRSCAQ